MNFFKKGSEGISIVYMTPKGTFFSPQAMENFKRQLFEEILKEVRSIPNQKFTGFSYVDQEFIAVDHVLEVFKKHGVTK